MDTLFKDLSYAGRGLLRSPGAALVAVTALALGIGFTTVMFSIVYGALYRGLPFEGAERFVHLERANPTRGIESMGVSIHDYRDWRERQGSFDHLAAFYMGTVNVRGSERPERYRGAFMTANSFEILGVRPLLGRAFTDEEELPGAPPVVILGHDVWQNRFGGGPDVLGRVVTVNGEAATVVGVMPEGFEFPVLQEVWVPLRLDHRTLERGAGQTLEVFGDLAEGMSMDQALREMNGIAAQLAAEHPETNEGVTVLLQPYTDEFIGDEERAVLHSMLLTVFLVLVIACANVANLLLARAATRTRDLAIRTAMGASRWRVITPLLAEAVVLAFAGALVGTGIAWLGIGLFDRAVAPTDPPFWLVFRLDAPILVFVLCMAVVAALVAGALPALKASGADLNGILKDESRGSSGMRIGRLTRGLVMGEIAMSMALLVASGLMVKGFATLSSEAYPLPVDDVFTARVGVFPERLPDEAARLRFWEEVEARVREVPGVRAVTVTGSLPLTGAFGARVAIDGESYEADRDLPTARFAVATPSFRETFDVEPVQGRWLETTDGADGPHVVVVNEAFVARHFPDGQALGRRVRLGGLESDDPWREVVGVVPDHRMEGIGNSGPDEPFDAPGFYVPLAQYDLRFASIVARTRGEPLGLAGAVRDAVAAADADTPIYFVRTLRQAIDRNIWFYGVFGTLFFAFGLGALFLASVGLYGVMSFSVSQRRGEMGVRMALGARAGQVVTLVLRQGLVQIVVGLALGAALAIPVARGLTIVLYQVEPWDPGTFAAVLAVLGVTGLAASAVPAVRATRVDPVVALQAE